MESDGASQLSLVEIRRKTVSEFVEKVSEGKLYLSVDQKKWRPQDVELISVTAGRLIRDISDYVSGSVAGEEFEFLEKQIFFSISVLRTYDALKSGLDETKIDNDIRRVEEKLDNLRARFDELLTIKESSLPQVKATGSGKRSTIREWKTPSKTVGKESPSLIAEESQLPPEDEEEVF
ncbi:MAG TPA: hypothetical protein VN739_03245 [Nitrososphaerales archaeon]|nr:hypothetical protein [Nitrososphaerales archaeon]